MASNTDFLLALEGVACRSTALGPSMGSTLCRYGELRVIIGPNGAGKTTVLDLICGRTRASEGSIKFKDQEITAGRNRRSSAAASGVSFRRRPSTKTSPCSKTSNSRCRAAAMSSARCSGTHADEVIERVREVAAMIYLQDQLDRPAETLSHGQKQWLEIGMLLIQDPESSCSTSRSPE